MWSLLGTTDKLQSVTSQRLQSRGAKITFSTGPQKDFKQIPLVLTKAAQTDVAKFSDVNLQRLSFKVANGYEQQKCQRNPLFLLHNARLFTNMQLVYSSAPSLCKCIMAFEWHQFLGLP